MLYREYVIHIHYIYFYYTTFGNLLRCVYVSKVYISYKVHNLTTLRRQLSRQGRNWYQNARLWNKGG